MIGIHQGVYSGGYLAGNTLCTPKTPENAFFRLPKTHTKACRGWVNGIKVYIRQNIPTKSSIRQTYPKMRFAGFLKRTHRHLLKRSVLIAGTGKVY